MEKKKWISESLTAHSHWDNSELQDLIFIHN